MSKEGAEGLPVSPEGVPRVIPIATYTFKNPEINDGHFSEQIRLDVKKVNIRFYCTSLTRTEKHKVPTSYLLSPLKEGDLGLNPIQLMTEDLCELPMLRRKHYSAYSGI